MEEDNVILDPREEGIEGLKGLSARRINPLGSSVDWSNKGVQLEMNLLLDLDRNQTDANEAVEVPYNFGESRYDKRVTELLNVNNLNEFRANEQSWIAKLGAGITKGTILAGTTFADGVVGSIAGVFNIINEADQDKIKSGKDVLNAFINNPFSLTMNQINNWAEKALPNYYSYAEQNDPWYTNIFTANFIGDKFLKNFGFMIGAAYAGRVNAGMLSKAMGLLEVRNAFKGVITTQSGKVLTDGAEIVKALLTGDAFMDGVKLTEDLAKSALKLKGAEFALKIVGSVSASAGEARIEAVSNSDEWSNLKMEQLNEEYQRGLKSIEYDLQHEHPEWFALVKDPDTFQWKMLLVNPEGQIMLLERLALLTNKYNETKSLIASQKAAMANEIFLANLAFLTLDNNLTLGRFFTGGYTRGRNFKNLIAKDAATGKFVGKKTGINLARADAIKTPFIEANEEMGLALISEATGIHASAEVNSFYGKSIDPTATLEMTDWYKAIREGVKQTYGNSARWEEGFIGGLTGLLGMPQFSIKTNDKGKKRPSVSLGGEMWESLRDASLMQKDLDEFLAKLNSTIKSEEFLNKFKTAVRDRVIKAQKEDALERGDMFEYKNAEVEEIVNLAIMFDKAGAITDLYDLIEAAENVSKEDIKQIREANIDKETNKSIFDGMSDEEVIESVKNEAKQVRRNVDTYVKIANDLKTLYGADIDSDTLSEITATLCSIDDLESRFKDIFEKVRGDLGNHLEARDSRYFGANSSKKLNIDLSTMSADELLRTKNKKEVIEAIQSNIDWRQRNNVPTKELLDLIKNLQDLIKIYSSRAEFIQKYNLLSKHPEWFTEQNKKQWEKMTEDATNQLADSAMLGLEGVATVADLRLKLPDDEVFREKIFERIEEKGSGTLKALIKKYKNYNESVLILNELVKENADPELLQVLENALNNNTEDFTQVLEELQNQLDNNELSDELKEKLIEIIGEFNTAKSEKKRTSNTPKEKTGPRKKPKSAFEGMRGALAEVEDALDEGEGSDAETIDELEAAAEEAETADDSPLDDDTSNEPAEEDTDNEYSPLLLAIFIDREEVLSEDDVIGITLGEHTFKIENTDVEKFHNLTVLELNTTKAKTLSSDYLLNIINKLENKEKLNSEELKYLLTLVKVWVSDILSDSENEGLLDTTSIEDLKEGIDAWNFSNKQAKELLDLFEAFKSVSETIGQSENEEEYSNSDKNADAYSGSVPSGYHLNLRSWTVTKYRITESKKGLMVAYTDQEYLPKIETLESLGAFLFVDEGHLGRMFLKNPKLDIYFIVPKKGVFAGVPLTAVKVYEKDVKSGIASKAIAHNGEYYLVVGELAANAKHLDELDLLKSAVVKDAVKNIDGDFGVSKNFKTKIKHIYSGRMVTSTPTIPKLKRVMDNSYISPTSKLAVVLANKAWRVPGVNSMQIEPLNDNNENHREGSVWLLTLEADGRWYAKAVQTVTFSEYDVDEHKDCELITNLKEDISILVSSNDTYSKLQAKIDIKNILYMPDNIDILFTDDNSTINIRYNNGTIRKIEITDDIDETVNNVIKALQAKELNLRFGVNGHLLLTNYASYVLLLLDAQILVTDILVHDGSTHNINGSFDMAMVDPETGEIEGIEEAQTGHTGRKGVDKSKKSVTMFFKSTSKGNHTWVKDSDDVWHEDSLDGEILDDEDTLIAKNLERLSNLTEGIEGTNIYYFNYHTGGKKQYLKRTHNNGFTSISDRMAEDEIAKAKEAKEKAKKEKKLGETADALEATEGLEGIPLLDASDEDENSDEEMPQFADAEDGEDDDNLDSGDDSEEMPGFVDVSEPGVPKKKGAKKVLPEPLKPIIDEDSSDEEMPGFVDVEEAPKPKLKEATPTGGTVSATDRRNRKREAQKVGVSSSSSPISLELLEMIISKEASKSVEKGLTINVAFLIREMQNKGIAVKLITNEKEAREALETFEKCKGGKISNFILQF